MLASEVLLQASALKPMIKKRVKRGLPKSWSAFEIAYPIRRNILQSADPTLFTFKDTQERFNKERGFRGENHSLDYSNSMLLEFAKCKNDPIYFIENYCHITTANGLQLINLRDFQVEAIETIHKNNKVLGLTSRQASKTTIVACYLAWCLCFQEYYQAGILSHTIQGSETILSRVYQILSNLPDFLAPCIVSKSKGFIETTTGVSIEAFASSGASLRGQTLALCYVDEASHLQVDLSVFYPEVVAPACSFRNSKVIMTTTPQGSDYFKTLWDGSKKILGLGGNGFATFTALWNDIPENLFCYTEPNNPTFDNGKSFKAGKLAASNLSQFQVEYECSFAAAANTLIDPISLASLVAGDVLDNSDSSLKIYEYPIEGRRYVIGFDPAGQTNHDYSVAVVYSIDHEKVVAVMRDNSSSIDEIAMMVGNLASIYGNAFIIPEVGDKHAIAQHILGLLHEEFDGELRFYTTRRAQSSRRSIGIATNRHNKQLALSLLKEKIESKKIQVNDPDIIHELKHFAEVKRLLSLSSVPTFAAQEGHHDDCVMALALIYLALDDPNFSDELYHAEWEALDVEEEYFDPVYSNWGCVMSGSY
ncbi:terminase large subunit domain-containing protein [Aeromonas veronii]|uniref:terminase large subunit domain-containing protein n=3 Tax=Aeromonas veronii TaxID=654 RepID=UPI000E1E2CC1|nr:terminase family protein [Aeromonas veronii]RDU80953.1 hypothetical protein CHF44_13000 [Aeromonas veronii]RDU88344.1 hypothetical protein CHH34_20515 [Aeromonas veronii]